MTTTTAETAPTSCYLLDDPPRSAGRVMLSRVLEEFVAIEWGIGPDDLANHFGSQRPDDHDERRFSEYIRNACSAIMDLALAERLQTYARPFGGGLPGPLDPSVWEIDDPQARFATSAIALASPFDDLVARTHWIFVDAADVAEMAARLCGGWPSELRTDVALADYPAIRQASGTDVAVRGQERLLRHAEVATRTGMSRSTIYAKIERGEFPEPVRLGSRFARWRETEVDDWIRRPR